MFATIEYTFAEKWIIPVGWLAGKELIIRPTQSSWSGAWTEPGKKEEQAGAEQCQAQVKLGLAKPAS